MAVGAISGVSNRQYVQNTRSTQATQAQPTVEETQSQNTQAVQETQSQNTQAVQETQSQNTQAVQETQSQNTQAVQETNSNNQREVTDSTTAVSNAQNILSAQINQDTVNQVAAVSNTEVADPSNTTEETVPEDTTEESNPVNDVLNQLRDVTIENSVAYTDGYKGILEDRFENLKAELSTALEESGSEHTLESLGLDDLDIAAEGSIQTIENAYAQINGTGYSTSGDLSVGVGDSEAVAPTTTPEEDTSTTGTPTTGTPNNDTSDNNTSDNNTEAEDDEYDAFKEFTGATLQYMYKYESYSNLFNFMNGSKSIYDILM
ncbi:hypothetical protein AN639_06895 [Candidatus Epulonipiscium fishelsonii]|uniref:Uncharacterized protein n=1 Tax=Candidatus Epulonipiscium fishelsonii TaxID=77094 RepID=A0ACC8XBJ1_9FIRM|nr:hypothetical protein AN639_06895 [Epulopiscium sp. SCG-B05WGA-EpuloA1]ONI39663.1 hypothetical protein AN396_07865 [Epulopiscium sp. SCG-B11WGA-EpuloA1]